MTTKRKKISMAHNEAEVQRFFTISSYASHSLQWTFLQVFNIDCILVLIFFFLLERNDNY